MDRSKEPKLSLNSNENYSPRLRVATDGRHLYTGMSCSCCNTSVNEVTGSGTTPQYFVDTWELKEKHLHFTQRKELKLPSDSLSSVSDGATCCCCKSVSFNSKWHKCTGTIYGCHGTTHMSQFAQLFISAHSASVYTLLYIVCLSIKWRVWIRFLLPLHRHLLMAPWYHNPKRILLWKHPLLFLRAFLPTALVEATL